MRLASRTESDSLADVLPVALRLAKAVKDAELETWVRLELLGYTSDNPVLTDEVVLPEYRTVMGEWMDEYGRVLVVDQPNLQFLNEIRLRQGAAELEALRHSSSTVLMMRLPDFGLIIQEALSVEVSLFRFNRSALATVLAGIRAELIDRLAPHFDSAPEHDAEDQPAILEVKPSFCGVTVDLKALWRRVTRRR